MLERQKGKEKGKTGGKEHLSSCGYLSKWLQQLYLSPAKICSLELFPRLSPVKNGSEDVGIFCCLPEHMRRKLDWKQSNSIHATAIWDADVSTSSLACATTQAPTFISVSLPTIILQTERKSQTLPVVRCLVFVGFQWDYCSTEYIYLVVKL